MTIRVLDPTSEFNSQQILPALRLSTLEGKTVGLISNGKEGTKEYFAYLDRAATGTIQGGQCNIAHEIKLQCTGRANYHR